MKDSEVALNILTILKESEDELQRRGELSRGLIQKYDDVTLGVDINNDKIREIYDYFWSFIVEDRPFSELLEMKSDFDSAIEILEGYCK